jgi:hypothetical protein
LIGPSILVLANDGVSASDRMKRRLTKPQRVRLGDFIMFRFEFLPMMKTTMDGVLRQKRDDEYPSLQLFASSNYCPGVCLRNENCGTGGAKLYTVLESAAIGEESIHGKATKQPQQCDRGGKVNKRVI